MTAAAGSFANLFFLSPTVSSTEGRRVRLPAYFRGGRRRVDFVAMAVDTSSSESSAAVSEEPVIKLEFFGPKPGEDGSYPVDRVSVKSGEKVLRSVMAENKLELYGPYGKVMNCGGGGTCGTCIVEVFDGRDLLSERTNAELKYLKKKPESWRLACQTIVGNKENAGKVKKGCDTETATMEKLIKDPLMVDSNVSQVDAQKPFISELGFVLGE